MTDRQRPLVSSNGTWRKCQCPLNWPFVMQQTIRQRRPCQTALSRPISDRLCAALPRDQSIMTRVIVLLRSCRPPTVGRCVRAIYVDSVYRMIDCWAWSHVARKCLERVQPLRAHRNPAHAVIAIGVVARIVATLLRLIPRFELWRESAAVLGKPCFLQLGLQTAAAISPARNQVVAVDALLTAAVTSTLPESADASILGAADYKKTAESFGGQVNQWRHASYCMTDRCRLWA